MDSIGFIVSLNQVLFGALSRTRTHISSKLVTVVRSGVSASMNSYRSGLLKILLNQMRVINLKPKNLRALSRFRKQLIWFVRDRSADRRWVFAGHGPWAMFLENAFWLIDMNSSCGGYFA